VVTTSSATSGKSSHGVRVTAWPKYQPTEPLIMLHGDGDSHMTFEYLGYPYILTMQHSCTVLEIIM
jgi:hypothetical protein